MQLVKTIQFFVNSCNKYLVPFKTKSSDNPIYNYIRKPMDFL